MLVVGLTGGIGAGKSSVADRLARKGAAVVDADAVVREVQAPGGPAFDPIVDRFGPGVVAPDGSLDRPALAALVFADAGALADLNAIVHPLVGAAMAERVLAHAGTDRVVVLDIPLLAEGGSSARSRWGLQAVIVVDVPVEVAVERLVRQRGMDECDARDRIAAQATRQERLAIADHVIDNSGDEAALDAAVDACWEWLQALPQPA